MQWIRVAPATAEAIIICIVIFSSCAVEAALNHLNLADVQQEWGAIQNREALDGMAAIGRTSELSLSGPLDVWNGNWWRIPISPFHHADLVHLIMSVAAVWYLGSRLERIWGSFAMCLFYIAATCIPVIAELYQGQSMTGLSGVVCALLGALVVLRYFDDRVANEFPTEAAEIGISIFLLAWIASLSQMISLPNAAHLAGFVYGGFIAFVTMGLRRHQAFLWVLMILGHVWLVPAIYLASHPVWIGRYQWYRAVSHQSPAQTKKNLQRAVKRDPSLTGAWLQLSQIAESQADLLGAWDQLIRGLYLNRSSMALIEGARRLWRHLDNQERREAEFLLQHLFGKSADLWLFQIRANGSGSDSNSLEDSISDDATVNVDQFALDQKIDLLGKELLSDQSKPQDRPIPVDENDAMEGKSL